MLFLLSLQPFWAGIKEIEMLRLIKEGITALSIFYHELALDRMGPTHPDFPEVMLHVRGLREELEEIRSGYAKA